MIAICYPWYIQDMLQAWLAEICRHPIISRSPLIEGFVRISGENAKEWKDYKRKQEATPYKISGFWQSGI